MSSCRQTSHSFSTQSSLVNFHVMVRSHEQEIGFGSAISRRNVEILLTNASGIKLDRRRALLGACLPGQAAGKRANHRQRCIGPHLVPYGLLNLRTANSVYPSWVFYRLLRHFRMTGRVAKRWTLGHSCLWLGPLSHNFLMLTGQGTMMEDGGWRRNRQVKSLK